MFLGFLLWGLCGWIWATQDHGLLPDIIYVAGSSRQNCSNCHSYYMKPQNYINFVCTLYPCMCVNSNCVVCSLLLSDFQGINKKFFDTKNINTQNDGKWTHNTR